MTTLYKTLPEIARMLNGVEFFAFRAPGRKFLVLLADLENVSEIFTTHAYTVSRYTRARARYVFANGRAGGNGRRFNTNPRCLAFSRGAETGPEGGG